jgi:hypothetical protein
MRTIHGSSAGDPSRQKGMVSLLWVLLMGLLSALALFRVLLAVSADTGIGIEYAEARQVIQASAQALEEGLAELGPQGTARTQAKANVTLPPQEENGLLRQVWFCAPETPASTLACAPNALETPVGCVPPPLESPALWAVGCAWFSDGQAGMSTLQGLLRSPGLARPPEAPVISLDAVQFEEGAWLANPEGRLNVWAALAQPESGVRPLSWIARKSKASSHAIPPMVCEDTADFLCTRPWPLRPDFLEDDPLLQSIDFPTLAQHYLGLPPTRYRDTVAGFVIPASELPAFDSLGGLSMWVGGDLDLSSALHLGTENAPVLLFVDGDLSLSSAADVVFEGFILVKGAIRIEGALNLKGAMVAGGPIHLSGKTRIAYHSAHFSNLATSGVFAPVIEGASLP